MLTVQETHILISFLLLGMAYIISISIIGLSQLMILSLVGDDSARRRFAPTSKYPLEHIDWIGLLLFITTGFGWSKTFYARPVGIMGKYKSIRRFIGRNCQIISCLLWAIVFLLIAFLDYGKVVMFHFLHYIGKDASFVDLIIRSVGSPMTGISTFSLIMGLFTFALVVFCVANASLQILLRLTDSFYYGTVVRYVKRDNSFVQTAVSLLFFVICRKSVFSLVLIGVIYTAQHVALLCGIS